MFALGLPTFFGLVVVLLAVDFLLGDGQSASPKNGLTALALR